VPATTMWTLSPERDEAAYDVIGTIKDDWIVSGISTAIPAGTTFDQWLGDFQRISMANASVGCNGGDPATWPSIQVGSQTGQLVTHCLDPVAVCHESRLSWRREVAPTYSAGSSSSVIRTTRWRTGRNS
jgi:hypothetical protein